MPLNAASNPRLHALQNISLLTLSLLFLPFDTFVLVVSYAYSCLLVSHPHSQVHYPESSKTILVTGVGMTKGLVLARIFHKASTRHNNLRVIGADFESIPFTSPGRFSRSLSKFYPLVPPTPSLPSAYTQSLLAIISSETVDIWISCSGVASAIEDAEAKEMIEEKTNCKCVQFDVRDTRRLHEKDSFIERTREIGLQVPKTYRITKRDQVEDILIKQTGGTRFILKPIGVDDAARSEAMALLPMESEEQTKKYLSRRAFSEEKPWVLMQFIHGQEFCTHALVIKGNVKAFVACPSAELLMHYTALPAGSALSQAMLQFTEKFAAAQGEEFTGHLSFDFMVEDISPNDPEDMVLYPIECNPRAHTAVCLFSETETLVAGYLGLLQEGEDDETGKAVITPTKPMNYYWIGHDFTSLVLLPLLQMLRMEISPAKYLQGLRTCLVHLSTWKDGTWELWDPLPWWILYHVYWPMQFFSCLTKGKRWSRVNVSTLKMFGC